MQNFKLGLIFFSFASLSIPLLCQRAEMKFRGLWWVIGLALGVLRCSLLRSALSSLMLSSWFLSAPQANKEWPVTYLSLSKLKSPPLSLLCTLLYLLMSSWTREHASAELTWITLGCFRSVAAEDEKLICSLASFSLIGMVLISWQEFDRRFY